MVVGGWERGTTGGTQMIFRAVKIYDIIMMDMYHYIFEQIHGIYNTKSKL